MRKSRMMLAGAVGLAAVLALSACSGGSSSTSASPSTGFSTNGKGKTITVWNMTGDLTDGTMKAINDEFTKETGAKVKVETQQWANITTKITTALATSTPPDVLELGNTQVPAFASSGGLADLTASKAKLQQGGMWLAGLEGPATFDKKLYAAPAFAATRVVIYNKKMWKEAGVTGTPTTYPALTAALDKVNAKFGKSSSDFSPFYLPGKYWYAGMQWIWDAGGNIAAESNGKWVGGVNSAASIQGLENFKKFQNTYSTKASAALDTTGTGQPDQDKDIFAQGKTSAVLGNSWEIGAIDQDSKKISKSDLGTFPFPGVSGKNQPVMLAGSSWGIAAKSQNQGLAQTWLKIATSESIQQNQIVDQGWIPVTTQMAATAQKSADAQSKAFFEAAQNSRATPAAANWATIEGDGAVQQLFSNVASGKASAKSAAETFNTHLNTVLNGSN